MGLWLSFHSSSSNSAEDAVGQEVCTSGVCTSECCASSQPLQISDAHIFQQTCKLQGKKWWQFSPEWYKTYPWLVLCSTRPKVFCSYCRSSDQVRLLKEERASGGDAFMSSGFDNWKKAHECFIQHERSSVQLPS